MPLFRQLPVVGLERQYLYFCTDKASSRVLVGDLPCASYAIALLVASLLLTLLLTERPVVRLVRLG
jgi:hypothetical protein